MLTDNTAAPLILLVEDDKNHADLMELSLQNAPEEYRLEIAATLNRARAAIERQTPGIVLASGYSEEEVTERFKGLGLNGFIQKPFNLKRLEDEVKGVLKKG